MDAFASLQRSIEKLVQIKCANYKEDYIKRRILSRMRLTNAADYEAYHRYLLANRRRSTCSGTPSPSTSRSSSGIPRSSRWCGGRCCRILPAAGDRSGSGVPVALRVKNPTRSPSSRTN